MENRENSADQVEAEVGLLRARVVELEQINALHLQTEDLLRQNEETFQLFADNTSEVLYIFNLETGQVEYINAAIERLTGYTVAESLTHTLHRVMPPDTYLEYMPKQVVRARSFLSGEPGAHVYVDELRHLRKDGSIYASEVSTRYMRNQRHQPISIGVLRDITERKQMQQALETLNRELEARVVERTHKYLVTIQQLEEEIVARQTVEDRLRQLQDSLVERVAAQGRKISKLYETILVHDDASSLEQLLAQTLDKMADLIEADAVCMHEVEGDQLALIASQGLAEADCKTLQLLPGGWLNEGMVLTSSDLRQDLRVPALLKQTAYAANIAIQVRLSQTELGVLQGFWRTQRRVAVEDIASFAIMAEQIAILLENVRLRRRLEQKAIQLERRRLARELHDSVTQSLHGLSLYVSALRNRLRRGQYEKAEETLSNLDQTARQTLKEMRLLLYEFRLDAQDNLRLVEQIETRLEAVEQRAGVDAALELPGPPAWPQAWEAKLYPVVMEALNNALKHANASQVRISLRGGQNWLELSICDNGRGFQTPIERTTGIGLQSMRERAELLGGTLQVESKIGEGTQVHLRIGTPARARKDATNGTDSRTDCR